MSEKYNKAWESFVDSCGESKPDIEEEFGAAWKACKSEVLKILNQSLKNCDLSEDKCDLRYIDRIKKL